jgi:hypothetical protein
MAETLKTQEQFSVKAGIQGLNGIAASDSFLPSSPHAVGGDPEIGIGCADQH